jgi:hypothetical protein
MPDPIIADTPFGETPAWPPSPARLDRELDAQNNAIINVDWSLDKISLTTDVQGLLPLSNIASNTGPYLLGSTATGSPVRITIGSNVTLSGDTLSAATSGGAGSGDFSTNTSTSVVNEIVLFSNTGGKQGKRSTGTGVCQLVAGVLNVAAVPLVGNVTGTLPAANMPALTGAVTSTVGTVATTIAPLAVTNAMLAGGITASNLVGSDINTLGTITAGNWAATPIPVAYGGTGSSSVAAARAALGLQSLTNVGDVDYTVLTTDNTVSLNAFLTAVRTWTLPQASTVNDGTVIKITDSVAGVSATNYVQIAPFAGDTISGSASSFILNKSYGVITLTKSKSTGWVVLATTSIIRRIFTSNQTYTTPVGIKAIFVEVIAGGGAGGGAAVSSSNLSVGGGGGGGGYGSVYLASPASSYLITVGPGGAGVSGSPGNNGSSTTFGAVCTALGGAGGAVLAAGTTVTAVVGGVGGGANVGDFFSFASSGSPGLRLSASTGVSGQGGAAALGIGGSNTPVIAPGSIAGNPGQQYGGGGSGAITTGAAAAGGAGSAGACFVTEYY